MILLLANAKRKRHKCTSIELNKIYMVTNLVLYMVHFLFSMVGGWVNGAVSQQTVLAFTIEREINTKAYFNMSIPS